MGFFKKLGKGIARLGQKAVSTAVALGQKAPGTIAHLGSKVAERAGVVKKVLATAAHIGGQINKIADKAADIGLNQVPIVGQAVTMAGSKGLLGKGVALAKKGVEVSGKVEKVSRKIEKGAKQVDAVVQKVLPSKPAQEPVSAAEKVIEAPDVAVAPALAPHAPPPVPPRRNIHSNVITGGDLVEQKGRLKPAVEQNSQASMAGNELSNAISARRYAIAGDDDEDEPY